MEVFSDVQLFMLLVLGILCLQANFLWSGVGYYGCLVCLYSIH